MGGRPAAGEPVPEVVQQIGAAWRSTASRLAAVGIDGSEAQLEAAVLLGAVLGLNRAALLARRGEPLPARAAERLEDIVRRRQAREPLAYIVGHREFYGLDLLVDRRVLVPRPETEGLVERVLRWVTTRGSGRPVVADVGTGSGCIAVALAVHLAGAKIYGLDTSDDALAVARANAARQRVDGRISFRCGDLLAALPEEVDIIVSNPPYIPSSEIPGLQPEVALYEPLLALDGGADGMDAIRRLLAAAPSHMKRAGALFVEIGAGQGQAALALAGAAFPGAAVSVDKDLAGWERYLNILT